MSYADYNITPEDCRQVSLQLACVDQITRKMWSDDNAAGQPSSIAQDSSTTATSTKHEFKLMCFNASGSMYISHHDGNNVSIKTGIA
jgi:hypothetical protein